MGTGSEASSWKCLVWAGRSPPFPITPSKSLEVLFDYPGLGFSQAGGDQLIGQTARSWFHRLSSWFPPLDLTHRLEKEPVGAHSPHNLRGSKGKAGLGRRAPRAGRGCAGRPRGQPACLVGWSSPEFPWREPSVEATLAVPVPTVWAARAPGARCNTGRETRERRTNTQPRGPGRRSAQPLRKRRQEGDVGPGGERENPHPLGPRAVRLVRPRSRGSAPEDTASLYHFRAPLPAGGRGGRGTHTGARPLSGAGLELSRERLFCGTKRYTCWCSSVQLGRALLWRMSDCRSG